MTDDASATGGPVEVGRAYGAGAPSEAEQVVWLQAASEAADGEQDVMSQVEQPAKVMRIGTMIKQLLEEVRAAPLDEAGRQRLREIHEASIHELEDGLSPDLREQVH